jgi:hypothetical protein
VVSEAFKLAILKQRVAGVRLYRLAIDNGLTPSLFSAMLHGARPVARGDERIAKIGARLGLQPHECFEESEGEKLARARGVRGEFEPPDAAA